MTTSLSNPAVNQKTRFSFALGDYGLNLVWQGTALFLMFFYTDVAGISPAAAGSIYLVAMMWDAVTDPVVATMVDRTRTRWGKYRPWIFIGALPLGISYPLAFSTTPFPELVSPVVWALITHVLLRTAYTISSIPFSSLHAGITSDTHERSAIAGFRMFGAGAGALSVVFITPILVAAFSADQARAYFLAAALSGVICALAILYFASTIREREPEAQSDAGLGKTSFLDDLKSIGPMFMSNMQLARIFGIIIVSSVCLAMFSKNLLYFFKYNLERPEIALWALVIPAFCLCFVSPLWVLVANKTSKRTALTSGSIVSLVGYGLFYIAPESNLTVIMATIGVIGVGSSALSVMFWAMLPDTIEYGQAKTGVRAEAKVYGFASFAVKAAIGINALALGFLLTSVGYEANVEQNEATLFGIKAIMVGIPALGSLIILGLLRGYVIDSAKHEELRRTISLSSAV